MTPDSATLVHVGEIPLRILRTDYQLPRLAEGKGVPPHLAPIDTVFDHYWKLVPDEFVFLDVGAKYGLSTILAARHMSSRGRRNPIVCFEPGAAAALIAHNIAMNGLAGRVTIETRAVSDRNGETLLYGDAAHPEDNHIIPRNVNQPFETTTVATVSLDSYVESRGIRAPLVVKVDTQGAEWEVWRGMQRLVTTELVTLMTEFTPWTFAGRAEPAAFLREICERHHIIHVRPKNLAGAFTESAAPYECVLPGALEAFTEQIAASAGGWTDLLCIPRRLPGCDELVEAVLADSR